jgi:Iron-containing redox enzyme
VLQLTTRDGSEPRVPQAAGPLSAELLDLLGRTADVEAEAEALARGDRFRALAAEVAEPCADDDLQLALYLGYELHYRGFPGVDPAWEWSPGLLALRATLERAFFAALESAVPVDPVDPETVGDLLFRIEAEDEGPSLSRELERDPDPEQFREFVVHRSLYQLKEADPHSWAIPRLRGAAKSALLEVQADEYGGGRPERIHSTLFAKTMRALGLDDRENAYLDRIPGVTLATVNLMSGTGLRRSRQGAIVGHLAMFEMTSAQPNRRYGNALRKLGFGEEATDFYDEHVEADAVHENIAAYDLAGGLARAAPELAADIVFGARALLHLEGRFARRLLDRWGAGESSLRRPL